METSELIKILIPYIVVQYGFALYCIIDIIRKGTDNLSKPIWIAIVFFSGIIGPVAYLLVGRRKDV
jgi:Na+-driven multidrug efflux pump